MDSSLVDIAVRLTSDDQTEAERALGDAIQRLSPRIRRFLRAREVSDFECDEVEGETWCRVWENRQTVDPLKSLQGWVFQIAINYFRDLCRAKGKAHFPVFCDPLVMDLESIDRVGSDEPKGTNADLLAKAKATMSALPPIDQLILHHYLEAYDRNWTSPELQELAGLTAHALRVRCHRLLAKIRRELEEFSSAHGHAETENRVVIGGRTDV